MKLFVHRLPRLLLAWNLLLLASGSLLHAQTPLRFIAAPYDVEEGESVVFSYLPDRSTVPYSAITGWRWDFDGDVLNGANASDPGWDVKKTVGGNVTADQINTSWQAVYNTAKGAELSATARNYRPRLAVITAGGTIQNTSTGTTEDTQRIDGNPDPFLTVRKKGTADDTISVNFYGNPRLARSHNAQPANPDRTKEIKFFSEVSFKTGVTGEVLGYYWDFNAPETGEGGYELSNSSKDSVVAKIAPDTVAASDGFTYLKPPNGGRSKYNVALKVRYRVRTSPDEWGPDRWSQPISKLDFLVIEDVPQNLFMGRSYRQGFPERYGWDDVVQSYSSAGANGNRYVYFNFLEDSFYEQYNLLISATGRNPYQDIAARNMAETVNELLQGQTLRGLQGMINALRIRYPRLVDPASVPERLPAPAGAREETAELERAALDFQQSIQFAAYAVRAYGPTILRPAPDPAKIAPYPQFPQYLTFDDSTLSGAPIPVKNEYWQFSGAADGQAQARVEKAKLLWRYSLQDATALPEAKEECKTAATQSYLAMALMANGQTENQFAQNEGNSLMAHLRIATDLFDKINAGVNPLGNDGSFIPNESFAAIYQDAQDAVGDARESEIEARNEERTFDRNQADLRNELLSQRNSYLTPLFLLTGIDPGEPYNYLQTVTDQKDYRNTFASRLKNLEENYPDADPTGLGEYGAQVAAIFDAGLNILDSTTALNNLYESNKISEWANEQVQLVNEGVSSSLAAISIVKGYANAFSNSTGTNSSVSFSPGSIISGVLGAVEIDIQTLQNAEIAEIQLKAEIQKNLLQAANLSIAIRRAKAQQDQAKLRLESMKAQMERLIEDLAHTRDTAADLYFQDPSFRVSASLAERRAQAELDYSIDKLYRLAKTLEYEWTEPYRNPVSIPASSHEPGALENSLFDKFTKLDSLFIVRSADEAKDYLDALRAWDSKLRRVNVTSVRGPNRSTPISAVPISLREHVLGYKPRVG